MIYPLDAVLIWFADVQTILVIYSKLRMFFSMFHVQRRIQNAFRHVRSNFFGRKKAVECFPKKTSIIDVWLGSNYTFDLGRVNTFVHWTPRYCYYVNYGSVKNSFINNKSYTARDLWNIRKMFHNINFIIHLTTSFNIYREGIICNSEV